MTRGGVFRFFHERVVHFADARQVAAQAEYPVLHVRKVARAGRHRVRERCVAELFRAATCLVHLTQYFVTPQIDALFLEQQFTIDLFPRVELSLRLLDIGDRAFERGIKSFLTGLELFLLCAQRRDAFFELGKILGCLLEIAAQ